MNARLSRSLRAITIEHPDLCSPEDFCGSFGQSVNWSSGQLVARLVEWSSACRDHSDKLNFLHSLVLFPFLSLHLVAAKAARAPTNLCSLSAGVRSRLPALCECFVHSSSRSQRWKQISARNSRMLRLKDASTRALRGEKREAICPPGRRWRDC